MCGIVIVGSGAGTWRDGGKLSFADEGGIFSALEVASWGFDVSVSDREA